LFDLSNGDLHGVKLALGQSFGLWGNRRHVGELEEG
jgi:hypothetical protein